MMKRLISLLLCIAMLAGMLTVTAVADPATDPTVPGDLFFGPIGFEKVWDPQRVWSDEQGDYNRATTGNPNRGDAKAVGQWQLAYTFRYPKAESPNQGVDVFAGVDKTHPENYYYIFEDRGTAGDYKDIAITLYDVGLDGQAGGADHTVEILLTAEAELKAYGNNCFVLAHARLDRGYFVSLNDTDYGPGDEVEFQIKDILKPETYTITYDLTGGALATGEENPVNYTIKTPEIELKNPSKEHYVFAGWEGTGLDQATVTVKIPTNSYDNRSYTATWTPKNYTISYELNGGSASNPAVYNIETPTFNLSTPTKAGYTFTGWTEGTDSTLNTTVTIAQGSTGNKTYKANWSNPIEYGISYNLDGGTVATANPVDYNVETATFTLNNPTKAGYTFIGWTEGTDPTLNTTVTIEKGSTGNKTYKANWSLNSYGITYNLAGGTVATANPTTYTVVSDDIILVNPTRGGYNFDGWTGSNGTTEQTSVTIAKGSTGDKTYTANWTPIVYTISYELGAEGTTTNPVEYTIETPTITLTDPTRWGFIFNGWTGNGVTTPTKNVTIDQGSFGDKAFKANYSPSELPEQLYPGESYVLRSGLDRSQYKVSGFDFTSGRRGFNGASYIESIKIDKNGDLVMTMKENFNLALDTDKVIKGEITVVDKTTKPQTKHYVPVEGKINNDVKDIFGAKKAAEAEDINPYWGENAVLVMDEDGGYVSFSEEMLSGVVKMKKNEKAYLNLIYGVNDITEDTIDAIEEYLGEDYVDDAIIEYYTFETKAFKNEVDFSYEAYEEDPHYFYLWKNGKLKKIDVTYNDEEDVEAWQWTADAEGTIIVTDVEIVLAEENTKNPNTGR